MSDKIEELKKRMYSTGGPKERRRKEFSEEVKSKSSKKKTYWSDEADTGIGAFSAETKEGLKRGSDSKASFFEMNSTGRFNFL